MAIRGELVGDAYVRIHADSTGMEAAIERQTRLAAEGAGHSFLERFDSYVEEHANRELTSINQAFARAVATGDWDTAWKRAGVSIDEFANKARTRLIEINDRLVEMNGPGGGMRDFNQRLNELDQWADRQGLVRVFRDVSGSAGQASEDIDAVRAVTEDSEGTFRRLRYQVRSLGDDVDENNRIFRRLGGTLERTVILMRSDNDLIGRMFGMGSRSELLNFFGRTMKFFTDLPSIALAGFSKVAFGLDKVIDQFTGLRAAGMGVGPALGLMASSMIQLLLPAIAAVTAAGIIISKLIPVILLLVLDLIGAVLALASALLVGLAGAIAVVAGGIPALAAGIGFVVIGMTHWKDASDKVKASLKPLTQAWAELKQRVGDEFLGQVAKNAKGLAEILRDVLKPMLFGIGQAFGTVLHTVTDLFNSDRMKPFLDALSQSIPKVLATLGRAIGKFAAGLVAALKPLLPYVQRLADWLERAASKFFAWATSAEGQTELKKWFADLWQSAKDLWNMLGSVSSVLMTIIKAATGVGSGGKGTGTDWIKTMTENLQKFDKWLNEPVSGEKEWNPLTKKFDVTSKTRIEKWFEDVATTINNLSTAISNLATQLSKVDWDKAREDLEGFLSGLAKVMQAIGFLIGFFNGLFDAMDRFGTRVNEILDENLGPLKEGLLGLPEQIGKIWSGLGEGISRLGTSISEAWNQITSSVSEAWNTFTSSLSESWNRFTEGLGLAGDDIYNNFVAPFQRGWNALFGDGGFFPRMREGLIEFFTVTIPEALSGYGENLHAALIQPWEDGWNALFGDGGFFPRLRENIVTWFSELPGVIGEWAGGIWDALTQPFRDWWNSLFGESIFPDVLNGVVEWLGKLPGAITEALSTIWNDLTKPFRDAWNTLNTELGGWPSKVTALLGQIPRAILLGLVMVGTYVLLPFLTAWTGLSGLITGWPGKIAGIVDDIPGAIGRALVGVGLAFATPFILAYTGVKRALEAIASLIRNFVFPTPSFPSLSLPGLPKKAAGGIAYGPMAALIGEAGREAIVPLDRPLSLVDPSVRLLSAFAQGKMASGGIGGAPQIVFEAGAITVVSPSARPDLVAEAVVDRIAARIVV